MEFYPCFLFLGVRISFNSCIIRALPSYAHLWEGGRINGLEGVHALIFMVIFGLGLAVGGFAGAIVYRDGARTGIAALQSLADITNIGIGHQVTSIRSTVTSPKLSKIHLEIGFDEFESIRSKRDQAVKLGILFASDADLVPAVVISDGQSLDAKVRLKGDLVDHLRTNKWSFRIETRNNQFIWGMENITIHQPGARAYHHEAMMHFMMRSVGVIAPQYFFVDVKINDRTKT